MCLGSSDSGALEQLIHQVSPALFFCCFLVKSPRWKGSTLDLCLFLKQASTCVEGRVVSGPNLQEEPMKYID